MRSGSRKSIVSILSFLLISVAFGASEPVGQAGNTLPPNSPPKALHQETVRSAHPGPRFINLDNPDQLLDLTGASTSSNPISGSGACAAS